MISHLLHTELPPITEATGDHSYAPISLEINEIPPAAIKYATGQLELLHEIFPKHKYINQKYTMEKNELEMQNWLSNHYISMWVVTYGHQ